MLGKRLMVADRVAKRRARRMDHLDDFEAVVIKMSHPDGYETGRQRKVNKSFRCPCGRARGARKGASKAGWLDMKSTVGE